MRAEIEVGQSPSRLKRPVDAGGFEQPSFRGGESGQYQKSHRVIHFEYEKTSCPSRVVTLFLIECSKKPFSLPRPRRCYRRRLPSESCEPAAILPCRAPKCGATRRFSTAP